MNIFQEIAGAISGVKAYFGFQYNKKGRVFWYGVLVVTIYFIVANIRGVIGVSGFLGGLEDQVRQNVPDFKLSNGKFSIEEDYYFEDGGSVIWFSGDDIIFSQGEAAWRSDLARYSAVLILDRNGALIKSDGDTQLTPWPDGLDFGKEELIELLPMLTVIMVVFFILKYIFSIALYFFAAIFVALVGMIVSSSKGYGFTFGKIYLLSIYGKTLALFIKGIWNLIGLSVPFMGLFIFAGGFAISCVYVSMAMGYIDRQRKISAQSQMPGQQSYMY